MKQVHNQAYIFERKEKNLQYEEHVKENAPKQQPLLLVEHTRLSIGCRRVL